MDSNALNFIYILFCLNIDFQNSFKKTFKSFNRMNEKEAILALHVDAVFGA